MSVAVERVEVDLGEPPEPSETLWTFNVLLRFDPSPESLTMAYTESDTPAVPAVTLNSQWFQTLVSLQARTQSQAC